MSDDISGLSFEDTSMDELLQRVAELSKQVMPGGAEASVMLIADEKPTSAATDQWSARIQPSHTRTGTLASAGSTVRSRIPSSAPIPRPG